MAEIALAERLTSPVVLLALTAVSSLIAYIYYRIACAPYHVFVDMGVKGPQPRAFVGNSPMYRLMGEVQLFKFLFRTYGKLSGFYLGTRPYLVIADPSLVQEMLVKESRSFTCEIVPFPNSGLHRPSSHPNNCAEEWAKVQSRLQSVFIPSKLKLMVPMIQRSCSKPLQCLQQVAASQQNIDVWNLYSVFTLESLCTGLGEGSGLTAAMASHLAQAVDAFFSLQVPENNRIESLMHWITTKVPISMELFQHCSRKVMAEARFIDVVQSLQHVIEAHLKCEGGKEKEVEESESLNEKNFLQLLTAMDKGAQNPGSNCPSREELTRCCLVFLLGGYETIPTILAYTAYLLALNPMVQDCVFSEISYHSKAKPTIVASTRMEVLDSVINETLRMYSPTFTITRRCTRACTLGSLYIPKGVKMVVPVDLIHHLPQYWEKPTTFLPDRFNNSKKPHPFGFLPFGGGSHTCLGMRFAHMIIKIVLIETLKQFKFIRTTLTRIPPQTVSASSRRPEIGIHLKVIQRKTKPQK